MSIKTISPLPPSFFLAGTSSSCLTKKESSSLSALVRGGRGEGYFNLSLPTEVKTIFKTFAKNPDSIRLVGGCVRDLILAKPVNDFDFATKLLPSEIIEILEIHQIKAIPTGINYGTITAVINHKNFEITTLRKDNDPDGRHLKAEFINDYYLDAARRDFTINALYLDDQGQIYDYFNGLKDLENKKVKFIGNAEERITEDYLRILRFFRFSCFYSSDFDQEGLNACVTLKSNLQKLSAERVRIEILKIFSCQKKENLIKTLNTLNDAKISEEILGNQHQFDYQKLKNLFLLEDKIKPQKLYYQIRSHNSKTFKNNYLLPFFTAIFNNDRKFEENLKLITTKLNLTNKEKNYCQFLSQTILKYSKLPNQEQLKRLLIEFDQGLVIDFYFFNLAQNFCDKTLETINQIKQNSDLITNFIKPNFPINGNCLTKLGYKGKKIGQMLEIAKEFWIKSDFKANKERLIKFLLKK